MLRGLYEGAVPVLKDKSAILQTDGDSHVWAQFDDVTLVIGETHMGFGWHKFAKSDFRVLASVCWDESR